MLAVLASSVMWLSGCVTPDERPSGPGPVTSATGSMGTPGPDLTSAATDAPVAEVLRFSSAMVGGGTFDGATLAGEPAVLWFWAAWCPRCRAAAPRVAAVQADFAGKINMVGVAGLRSGSDSMTAFVRETGIGAFPNLADDDGVIWRKFGVTAQEFFVVIDATGTVVHRGPLSADELRDRVAALAG